MTAYTVYPFCLCQSLAADGTSIQLLIVSSHMICNISELRYFGNCKEKTFKVINKNFKSRQFKVFRLMSIIYTPSKWSIIFGTKIDKSKLHRFVRGSLITSESCPDVLISVLDNCVVLLAAWVRFPTRMSSQLARRWQTS